MSSLRVSENHVNLDEMFEFVELSTNQFSTIKDETEEEEVIKSEDVKIEVNLRDDVCDFGDFINNNTPIKIDKNFSCPYCEYSTKKKEECQEHINGVHMNIKPYTCSIEGCSFSTSYKNGLKKHTASVHSDFTPDTKPSVIKRFLCDKCDFKTHKKCYLVEHVNGVHEGVKPYECTVEGCSFATSYRGGLKKHTEAVHLHLRSAVREKKWLCNYCEFKTGREIYLKEHIMAKHENDRPFSCTYDDCSYATVSKNSLKKHVDKVHLKLKESLCDKCDFAATNKSILRMHQADMHGVAKPYVCSYIGCNYSTVYANSFRSHTDRVHLNLMPYTCGREDCSYATNVKGQLLKHISAVHDKTLPFSCEFIDCSYRANFKSCLKKHVTRVHLNSGEGEVFQCQDCEYKAKTPQMLKWHTNAIHLGLLEKCPECDFETKWYTSLRSHIRNVHKGVRRKEYLCDLCNYQCARKYTLRTHYNGVHLGISHQCPMCPMKSNWKQKIDRHIKEVHDNKDTPCFFCDQCDFQTFRRWRLAPHIYFSHGEGASIEFLKDSLGRYYCTKCEFKTFKRENIKSHHYQDKHTSRNNAGTSPVCEKYACDQCGFQTISPRKFSMHVFYKHGEGKEFVFEKNQDGIFQCEQCDFNTLSTYSIKSHYFCKKHTATVQRSCANCDFQAATAIQMKLHMYYSHGEGVHIEIETDEVGNYRCFKCNFCTGNETLHKYHVMCGEHKVLSTNASQPRQKFCDECDYTAKFPGELERHVYYKHGGGVDITFTLANGKYKCDNCSYESAMTSNLKRHYFVNHVKSTTMSVPGESILS